MGLKTKAWALMVAAMLGSMGLSYGQTTDGTIGYPSPAAAFQALQARPDVVFSAQNGWVVAQDRANHTIWTFAPAGNPAYPAAVKRQIVQAGDRIYIQTAILCGGTQEACDKLAADIRALNQRVKQTARSTP